VKRPRSPRPVVPPDRLVIGSVSVAVLLLNRTAEDQVAGDRTAAWIGAYVLPALTADGVVYGPLLP
jgi:hypothetical protein